MQFVPLLHFPVIDQMQKGNLLHFITGSLIAPLLLNFLNNSLAVGCCHLQDVFLHLPKIKFLQTPSRHLSLI